jgi:hypothetical protein
VVKRGLLMLVRYALAASGASAEAT